MVESAAVQAAFATIWQQSNYGAAHTARREQGGWITKGTGGVLQFTPFPAEWQRMPCSIGFPDSVVPPPALVAWVHTHPYRNGELLTECEQHQLPGGLQRPYTYTGDPSDADDEITRTLRQSGYSSLRGYVIDADKITWFNGDNTPGTVGSWPRCGY